MARLLLGLLLLASLASGSAARAGSSLVLYTSQPDQDAARTVAGFRKRNPEIEVDIFRSGTTEVMAKLQAEFAAGQPKPDVVFIADAVTMERLKADGRLEPYAAADVSQLPPGSYDPQKTYFGTKLITTGIMINTAAPMRPKSWNDLLWPEAKNQVILPSPLYSGAAAIHMGALGADRRIGPAFYDALAKNGAIAARGNGAVMTAVAGGQRFYGVIVEFMALNAKAKGSPVDFIFPEEGVSAVTEPVAMLKTAPNPAAARAFIDFVLSKEGQALAASQGYLPARRDVDPPTGFPKVDEVELMPVDVPDVIAHDEANKRRFADLFGG
ncbi:MAG: ABC transporter substrate-binding protein [Proteobacteria bacterium]|nr:ABC transporter substrate-binding protein [Pseudomonadota bacterium]